MSNRIARRHVDAALERYVRALRLAGLERFGNVYLHHGSKANAVPFMLLRKDQEGSPVYAPGTDSGLIGWTLREAYSTLLTLARAYEDMAFWASAEWGGLMEQHDNECNCDSGYTCILCIMGGADCE